MPQYFYDFQLNCVYAGMEICESCPMWQGMHIHRTIGEFVGRNFHIAYKLILG